MKTFTEILSFIFVQHPLEILYVVLGGIVFYCIGQTSFFKSVPVTGGRVSGISKVLAVLFLFSGSITAMDASVDTLATKKTKTRVIEHLKTILLFVIFFIWVIGFFAIVLRLN